MQAFGRPDERVVHVLLMDSLIGSALTSEPVERGWPNTGREKSTEINTASERLQA